ncbi:MAG: DUF4296 domain-containing protein [Paludibacteraceae bacterium]|nr:DUF4296 domain-containing protein [Paludibacteraceae bacterium]
MLTLLLAMTTCADRHEDILSTRKMRDVLVDIHTASGMMQASGITGTDNLQRRNAYYQWVLQKHGITQAQFDSSLVYYTAHPNQFENLYAKVQDELNQRVKRMEDMKYLESNIADLQYFVLRGYDIPTVSMTDTSIMRSPAHDMLCKPYRYPQQKHPDVPILKNQ